MSHEAPNLSRKNRRARIAALVSSFPGVMSGGLVAGAVFEAAQAQPASAAQEHTLGHEALTPAVVIAQTDKNLLSLASKIESSGHQQTVDLSKYIKGSKDTIHYVVVPSKKARGRYDWIGVTIRKGVAIPVSADVLLGADSNQFGASTNFNLALNMTHQNIKHVFRPGEIYLSDITNPKHSSTYSVNTDRQISPGVPVPVFGEWKTETAKDAQPTKSVSGSVVSTQFTGFFAKTQVVWGEQ